MKLFNQELKALVTNRKMLIPVIAVLFIPLLYSGMFLWAFWDPYAHLDELPVAIVNNDKGASLNGEKLEVGGELVKTLKKHETFQWHFVSEAEAEKGLKQQKYYMVVKIPENFSEHATTIQDEHPKKMKLIYMPNESFNFLAAQIGNTAVEKIKEELSRTVTAAYAETMLESIRKAAEGLDRASDGASSLHEGISRVNDGAMKLQEGLRSAEKGSGQLQQGAGAAKQGAEQLYRNLKVFAEKSLELENGMQSASEGSQRLASGLEKLNSGFIRMEDGQMQLAEGAKKAEDGTKQLAVGMKQSLAGTEQIKENVQQLAEGALQLKNGANHLASSLEQWRQEAEGAKTGADQVSSGLQQALAHLDAIIAQTADANEKAALETFKSQLILLAEGSEKVADGVEQLAGGAGVLKTGAVQLEQGSTQLYHGELALDRGLEQLVTGQKKLVEGADSLTKGQEELLKGLAMFGEKMAEAKQGTTALADGSSELSSGLKKLASGSVHLQTGAAQLADGSGKLSEGIGKLAGGAHKLSSGMVQLSDGASELAVGMERLDNGAKELADKLAEGAGKADDVKATGEIYEMFSEPVKLKSERIHHVPNYGTGFTPYFLSLGLFVGALLLSIVFPLREPAGVPSSGWRWFAGKFGVLAIIGVIQALLADLVLLGGLGLQVQNVAHFVGFSIVTSFAFLALIQLLVTTMGDPGRFVGIIILILQLTTSAGTFPLELIPETLQPFNHYLPMTYSVFGFKAVISSGDTAFMWKNAAVLAAYIAASALGTILYLNVQYKKQFYKINQNAVKAPQA